jgi:Fe-S cluster assembly scaffold protein SufB
VPLCFGVDQRRLETLMVQGLTPEEAVDVIVRGY